MAKTAIATRPMARISIKDSVLVLKKIRNKPVNKVKTFLKELIDEKKDIECKHYTGASKEILSVIEEAETNAEALGLDTEKLFLKEVTANKSVTFMLPKSRYSHRGKRAKICQIKVTVEER